VPDEPTRRLDEGALRADRQRDEHRALGRGRVHDSESIGGELALAIRRRADRPLGTAVAAPVECDHAAVPGQVGDLHLPVP